MATIVDVAVIGAGPAGLFSVFQAGMLGMSCAVIDTLEYPGGQCSALYPQKPIYDIPGFPQIMAAELIDNLLKQASPFKPNYFLGNTITQLEQQHDGWVLLTSKGLGIHAKSVIIAAGCGSFEPNRLLIENAGQFENTSLLYFVDNVAQFKNKKVVIAGGGDSAVDWAVLLSEIAQKVYVVHRRNKFKAFEGSIKKMEQLVAKGSIELITPYQIKDLKGSGSNLSEVVVKDFDSNVKSIAADYLLPFYGLKMELGAIVNWGLNLDKHHIKVDPQTMQTNLNKVYAIGDIAIYPNKLKLILTGFAEAALAVHQAQKAIFPNKTFHFEYSTTKGLPSLS